MDATDRAVLKRLVERYGSTVVRTEVTEISKTAWEDAKVIRLVSIDNMKTEGKTNAEIARAFGISTTRVAQILANIARWKHHPRGGTWQRITSQYEKLLPGISDGRTTPVERVDEMEAWADGVPR